MSVGRLFRELTLFAVLIGVAVSLGLATVTMRREPVRPFVPTLSAANSPDGGVAAALSTMGDASNGAPLVYTHLITRPLFASGRRPFVGGTADREGEPRVRDIVANGSMLANVRVAGVLMFGDVQKTMLQTPRHPDGVWVETGEMIDGMLVEILDAETIRVSNGVEEVVLRAAIAEN